jgi:hypothetical protein
MQRFSKPLTRNYLSSKARLARWLRDVSGPIRLVILPTEAHLDHLASVLRTLKRGDSKVLFVTVTRPYASLVEGLRSMDIDLEGIQFLDAITSLNGNMPQGPRDGVRFIRSPTMLELIAMHMGEAHVVIDSLSALVIYNGVVPVQEFTHFLATRLRHCDVGGDFLIVNNRDGQRLQELLGGVADATHLVEDAV